MTDLTSYFWARVERGESCWLWTGSRNQLGYGTMRVEPKRIAAHRFAYELLVGPIPEGLELDHLCRVPGCVNPDHLEPVTHRENLLRGVSPSGRYARRTHCKHGHKFTPENTYPSPTIRRRCCKTCKRAAVLRCYYKRKAGSS